MIHTGIEVLNTSFHDQRTNYEIHYRRGAKIKVLQVRNLPEFQNIVLINKHVM